MITEDGYLCAASEVGTFAYAPEIVVAKGRVGPSQIVAVDTYIGEVMHTKDVDQHLKTMRPYKKWLHKSAIRFESKFDDGQSFEDFSHAKLQQHMKMFQVTTEECDQVIRPLAENSRGAVGSMGDDIPMAILSSQCRPVYDYFRQQFAQVTNTPIDPLREAMVMSLETCLGHERNIFQESPELARRIVLGLPVMSASKFTALRHVMPNMPSN